MHNTRLLRAVIVDGDPLGRERLRTLLHLERDVDIVGEYRSGADALDAVPHDAPDLLFLEVALPDASGLDIVERLKGTPGMQMPLVVFVTAHYERIDDATNSGAFICLPKPFASDAFRAALAHVRSAVVRSS